MEKEFDQEAFFKKMYEDLIISGRFDSDCLSDLGLAGQKNEYGDSRQMDVTMRSACATNLVSLRNGLDEEVTKGIAVGIAVGKPVFGQIGEEFLKSKVKNVSPSSLGVAFTKVSVVDLSGERIEKLIAGVRNVLDGKETLTEEEKAAKLANDIFDATGKLSGSQNLVRTKLVSQVLDKTTENGTITAPDASEWKNITERESERQARTYGQHERDLLNSAFDYYMLHQTEVNEDFISALSEYPLEEIVAYYVLSKGEGELEKILSDKEKGTIN